jgi:5'-nucleotidase
VKRSAFLVLVLFVACKTAEPVPDQPAAAQPAAIAPAPAPAEPIHLTIVGTNDTHGWVTGKDDLGGVALLSAHVKKVRAENPGGVILIDAGDLFQGTLVSNLSEGEVVIEAYNAIGYDAASIGNHEFDYGPVGPHVTAEQPGEDVFGALKARIKQAHFPLLSANIYEADGGLRPEWLPGDGTLLLERKGVKVGIIGLTTPQTPYTTLPVNVATLKFNALAPEAATGAKHLREQGAQVVVAVMHAGGKCSTLKDPNDTSSCDVAEGEVFTMLNALPPGTLDAVVAGHSHNTIGHFFQQTPIIETPGQAKFYGRIELYVDPATHAVKRELTTIAPMIPVKASEAVQPDAEVAKLIQPALDKVSELQHKKLGLSVPSTLGRNYDAESPLGSFLADSLRTAEKADVAILNPGGLRADLKSGELTYGAVFEVMPFDNNVATLDVSGEELLRLLKAAYGGKKGIFQVSGIEVKLAKCPSPERLKTVTLEGGKPLAPARRYRLVLPDFLARGGDGLGPAMATLDPAHVDVGQNRTQNMRDVLVAYWQAKNKPLTAPKLGRLSLTNDAAPCPVPESAERGQ